MAFAFSRFDTPLHQVLVITSPLIASFPSSLTDESIQLPFQAAP